MTQDGEMPGDPAVGGPGRQPPTPGDPDAAPRGFLARSWWVVGLAIAGLVAVLAALFASGDPDGLDSVAIEQGFEGAAEDPGLQVLPGYAIPGLEGPASTIVAGVVGIAVIFALVFVLGRVLARRRKGRGA
jgi:cobalt/nickel transport system permease protein